jgi:hypothetical protein
MENRIFLLDIAVLHLGCRAASARLWRLLAR